MSDSEARRSLSPRAPPPPRARQNGLYQGKSGLWSTSRRSFCGPPHHRPLRSEHDAPDGNDDAHATTPSLLTTVTPLRHSAPPPTVRAHPSPLAPCLLVPFLAIFASISSALSTVMGMFTRHRNGPSAVPQTPKMPSIALPESPAQWASTTRARRSSSNAGRPVIPPRPMQAPQMSMDATRAQAPSRQSTRPRAQSLLAAVVTPKPLKPILKSSRRATIPASSTAGGWTPSATTPVETVTTSGRNQIYGPKVRGKTYYPDGRVADHDGNVYPEYPGDPRVTTADRARSVAGHRPSRSEGRTGGQDRRAVEQRDAGYTSDMHDSVSRRPRGPNLGIGSLSIYLHHELTTPSQSR
ncbi:uncharacterized protein SCHCODRAFT_02494150 [Schizophyllum commune H4-8]|uniref:uncharacterized protein n=1 Tax=Schizophyllum commune (strain H4-8 / FGSC 9210) TaxID=578458 RepID=UPI00215F5C43|nr:uncharacterized protein SCHCODRAFT_02494150 [Schizophyllum commune H4-8]KAI5897017.1 hypothetical protein SCHCODRAFT_02494150 [Schizophyllum commune H4-8]